VSNLPSDQSLVEQRITAIEDTEAIRRLHNEYAAWCDASYNATEIAKLFAEDGQWVHPDFGTQTGRSAIESFFNGMSDVIKWAIHHMSNGIIELGDDGLTANGKWNMLVLCSMVHSDDPEECDAVVISGGYDNDFIKVDGAWKIQVMRGNNHHISNLDQGWVKQQWRP
jgi:hypothetical protein